MSLEFFSRSDKEEETSFGIPSYLVAADSHSVANNNQSFLESATETISNIPKFIGVSLISGANQIYNIAPTLGNFLGGDFALSKTADVMEALDDDLGAYYAEHEESADVAGFLISSIVPGIGGIKLLNAGQKVLETSIASGRFGAGMSKGLGLLVPQRQKYLDKAINEITNSNSLSLLTNTNTMKAMAAGYGQAVLEMAAFETAVTATLSSSPVLENQDIGDIVTNIAVGGLVFGTIGGVIDITKSSFAIKNAVKEADKQAAPWTHINVLHQGASPSNKLIYDLEQYHNIKEVPVVFSPERKAFLDAAAKTKQRRLLVQARKSLGELASGDQVIADQAYAMTIGADFQTQLGNYLTSTRISRVADKTAPEKIISRIDKKVKAGTASIKEVEELGDLNFKASYITTWGEGIGNTVEKVPQHLTLSDTLTKGQQIIVKGNKITAGKRVWNFSVKEKDNWDVLTAGTLEAQARHIWALESAPFVSKAQIAKGKIPSIIVNENDIPLLDKLYREFRPEHGVKLKDGTTKYFANEREFLDFLHTKKVDAANEFLVSKAGKGKSQEDIASVLNIRPTRLSGQVSDNIHKDLFALQHYSEEYTKMLVDKGLHKPTDGIIPVYKLPRQLKISYDTTPMVDVDGNLIEGIAMITQQERLQAQRLQNITAGYFKEDTDKFIELSLSDVLDANRSGAGASLLTAASSNYGSLASKVEYLGQVTTSVIEKRQAAIRNALEAPLIKLAQNQEAVIEWSNLNARLRSIPDKYVLNETGDALELAAVARARAIEAEGGTPRAIKLIAKDAPEEIPLTTPEVRILAKAHIESNSQRLDHATALRTAQGYSNAKDTNVFYPTPVDPKEYPFFALVKDDSITGTGHTKTLYASSESELESMIAKLADEPNLTILTKTDAENYYKAIGQFDNTRSLNENYLDITMHRKGISAPYFVPTDPNKVTSDLLNWHLKQETSLAREFVSARYERQFEELRKRGEEFTNLATSQFSSKAMLKHAENVVKNPYMDYIKTALGIRNYADYPFWTSANRMIDSKASEMWEQVTKVVEGSKSSEELTEVNRLLNKYGYKGAAYDMEMDFLANHTAPKGALVSFVQKANALLAAVVLRLDHLNAANNYISANILFGAEMKSLIRAIETGNTNAAGELAALSKIKVPGTDKLIQSPSKLLAGAYKAFGRDTPEMQFYRDNRFVTNISDQYRWTLDNLTLGGKESVRDLESKISKVHTALRKAADKGERWTGNRLAEEFNRFAAAHSMKQVTDIAVKYGIIDERTALSYINTFVNRTQGNYLAAQRPMLFQGAIGQSIGLFQTYQFNLMQQLLRHVGEGAAKDSMTLLGLQGTVYGLNGLPAFNAINTHIVGTASGNEKHKDFYTTVYGAAGKDAGDWLMYGLSSNILLHPDLKTNLYVRGDINPRHVTIVPTDPASVPIVQATGKFFANLIDTAGKITNGGDFITSVLQGVEHNGISRPLAGLAQTLQGFNNPNYASYSTSKRGNVIASNDVLSLANISRMLGGKPLGEAVALDAAYRFKSYALHDNAKKSQLGETIKSTIIAGKRPSQEQIEDFAAKYVSLGGRRTEFNKWMMQLYKTANTSQANDLRRKLSSPFSQNMQVIMGGYELADFSNQ